jgi:hypothetical protein
MIISCLPDVCQWYAWGVLTFHLFYEEDFAPENADARQKTQQGWAPCEAF